MPKRWPITEAACSARLSAGGRRSSRDCTTLCSVSGTASRSRSVALRRSCSRNSGLPSARAMQASASRLSGSTSAAASALASPACSGPRSIVSTEAPRAAFRQPWSIGSPSKRDVITRAIGLPAHARGQRREVGQKIAVRPVQVLDDQHQGLRARSGLDRLDEHGLPRALPRGVVHRIVDRAQRRRQLQVEQVEQGRPVMRVDAAFARRFGRCRARRLVGIDAQAERGAQQGAHRIAALAGAEIEDQAAMAGQAAPAGDGGELLDQARLADAGLAAHIDELAGAGTPAANRARLRTAAARRAGRPAAPPAAPSSARRPSTRQTRTGLPRPRTSTSPTRLGVDDVGDRIVHRLGDERLAGFRHVFEPGREIHRIAGDGVVLPRPAAHAGSDDLAAGDADMDTERMPELAAELGDGGMDFERCAHGALGIVAMRHGGAEHAHDAVAGVLVDAAAIRGDETVHDLEEARQQRVVLFGIERCAQPRIAGEIGKQGRDLAALAGRGGRRRLGSGGDRRAAHAAESRIRAERRAALRAETVAPARHGCSGAIIGAAARPVLHTAFIHRRQAASYYKGVGTEHAWRTTARCWARSEQKLVETKQKWAGEGRLLTGRTRRPAAERLPPGQREVKNWPVLDLGNQPERDGGELAPRCRRPGREQDLVVLRRFPRRGPGAGHLGHPLRHRMVALRQPLGRCFDAPPARDRPAEARGEVRHPAQLRRLHDQRGAGRFRGRGRAAGVAAGKASRSRASMAARCGWCCRSCISGRAPNGSRGSSSGPTTSPASGKCAAITITPTRGRRNVMADWRLS